ncbi:MAG: RidA family protein [Candidatus Brocadiae bacterium]|nr:RidA family protein [Candidatus Brocadiia bacterium]
MNILSAINPATLGKPSGYNNGMLAGRGARALEVAGQVAWDQAHRIVSKDFIGQFDQALRNFMDVVRHAGGGPEHVAEMTIYLTDKKAYLDSVKKLGEVWRAVMGKNFPAMAAVVVAGLVEEGAQVEIKGTAYLPLDGAR